MWKLSRSLGSTSSKEMTMGRRNKMEEMSATVEEYLRKIKRSVCYTPGVLVRYR